MSGEYYDHTTYPSQGAAGSSSAARAEFELIEAGFDKLPGLTGNGGKMVAVNAGGTALEALTAAQALAAIGAQATSGKDASGGYAGLTLFKLNLSNAANTFTSFLTNAATAARTWTMPDYDGTLATLAGAETLSNKTLTTPVINGFSGIGNGAMTGNLAVTGALSATGALTTAGLKEDASGNLGLGGSAGAAYRLHVQASDAQIALQDNNTIKGGGPSAYINLLASDARAGYFGFAGANDLRIMNDSNGSIIFGTNAADRMDLDASGNLAPGSTGAGRLGTTSLRWGELWVTTGAFNTSDARQKTAVSSLTANEIAAAKALSKEIGTYQWLASVAAKGADQARQHIGFTVQRAQEILESFGLDPWRYGFMAYDQWGDEFVEHAAIAAAPAALDDEGNIVTPAVEAQAAWTEQTKVAGDAYAFRYDQLNLFIAAGLEARLAALEAA